ncbi:MAG: uroporphyrinogen-III C-methyltransferase [Dehalococcoidia bacterium]|nr:uroporphyrinogen-III C-methyltransferase [Dehalococcoidia bacterium]MDW8119494.1 uroporphyrinogen-III C-methyltransferase [Chloroflexota bacterium]
MRLGTVYIVGAGPGDPGLITVKGLRLLRTAEVVVYDRLVHPDLVAEAPPAAEKVPVGKEPGHHTYPQEVINALLVGYARRGKRVVRLKGGDPFVFGRGGEEAEALAAAGIPFEVVPGVSSAIAVPAYAGIPVTDRRYAAGLRIIAGHGAGTTLPPQQETVVVLMPVGALSQVVERLRHQGWTEGTPVAFIEQGTLPSQRTLVTTLGQAIQTARNASLQAPAVMVVGEVVRLRERIAWAEKRSGIGNPPPTRSASLLPIGSSAPHI